MKHWSFDDEPSDRFPLYCRGNAGEIVPNAVTPLTSTILTPVFNTAFADLFAGTGAFTAEELDEPAGACGMFGSYLYLNLALPRLLAVRMPGLKVGDVDRQLIGNSSAPPYRPRSGDRSLRLTARAMVDMLRSSLRPPHIDLAGQRAESVAWLASLDDDVSDDELISRASTYADRFAAKLPALLEATTRGALPVVIVERLTKKMRVDDPGLISRIIGGVGAIETALPPIALWHLGRRVAASPTLTAEFDDGTRGLIERLEQRREDAHVAGFFQELDGFLAVHGHRGPNEIELASDTWATNPEIALAAVERLRLSPADADPETSVRRALLDRSTATSTTRAALRRPLRRLFDRLLASAADGAVARETAKATIVLDLFGLRRGLFELADRLVQRGVIADRMSMFMVGVDELPTLVADGPTLTNEISERRRRYEELNSLVPPFFFEGEMPDPSTWERRDAAFGGASSDVGDVLTGIGVSSGIATGIARIVTDPADPRGLSPGEVLVAPITDPAWTPLFLAATCVVVDVGALQSHAAIVARELGIPAVVSVHNATRLLTDGMTIEVDGNRGTVRILRAPEP